MLSPPFSNTFPCEALFKLTKLSCAAVQISNVIDVADHNPPPKGCPDRLCPRSILVLTPNRALKFTAPTLERHHVWLTALSFLSHAPNGTGDLLGLPSPLPHLDYTTESGTASTPTPHQLALLSSSSAAPTIRTRRPVRDSIRLAKARVREPFGQVPMMPAGAGSGTVPEQKPTGMGYGGPGLSENRISMASMASATPPPIARYPPVPPIPERDARHHYRKRSNTGGRVQPPSGLRAFSGGLGIHSGLTAESVSTNASQLRSFDGGSNNSGMGPGFGLGEQQSESVTSSMRGDPYSRPYRSAFPASAASQYGNGNGGSSAFASASSNIFALQPTSPPPPPPVPRIPSNFFEATSNGSGSGTVRMQAFVGGAAAASPTPSMALEQQDAFPEGSGAWGGGAGGGGYGYGLGNGNGNGNGKGRERERDARVLGIARRVPTYWGDRESRDDGSVLSGGSAGDLFREF